MPACSDQRKLLRHRQATSSPASPPRLVVQVLGWQPWVSRYPQHVPTGREHLSEEVLFERACAPRDPGGSPQIEFLGAFSIEEGATETQRRRPAITTRRATWRHSATPTGGSASRGGD